MPETKDESKLNPQDLLYGRGLPRFMLILCTIKSPVADQEGLSYQIILHRCPNCFVISNNQDIYGMLDWTTQYK